MSRTVAIYRAEGIRDESVHPVTIVIEATVPTKGSPAEQAALYASEGAALAEAIWGACPGGTVDALIAALLARRASMFRVSFGPWEHDDVVEVEVVGEDVP